MFAIYPGCRVDRGEYPGTAGYLRADIDTSPLPLDPRYGTDAVTSRINELIFESLARVDAHGAIVGVLAHRSIGPRPPNWCSICGPAYVSATDAR